MAATFAISVFTQDLNQLSVFSLGSGNSNQLLKVSPLLPKAAYSEWLGLHGGVFVGPVRAHPSKQEVS